MKRISGLIVRHPGQTISVLGLVLLVLALSACIFSAEILEVETMVEAFRGNALWLIASLLLAVSGSIWSIKERPEQEIHEILGGVAIEDRYR